MTGRACPGPAGLVITVPGPTEAVLEEAAFRLGISGMRAASDTIAARMACRSGC